jgi:RNA polymerase sigma-70 factor, ECF subfamily
VQEAEGVWILQAQEGDDEAFTRLVDAYQVPVYNLCYRMLGDGPEAEDAAQETFIRAYKGLSSYDSRRSFSTWLLSIAAHYCIDQIRRKRIIATPIPDLPYEEIPDPALNPEMTVSKKEQDQRIRRLLDTLNATDRAAVVMYYWYDFSYDEISKALNLTASAVKSRLHRARGEMAKHWQTETTAPLMVERQGYESSTF